MKGGSGGVSSSYSLPAKRRWKGLVIAVLGLVFLSMLVPLVFLLGLHSGFHSTTGNTLFPLPISCFRLDLLHRSGLTLPMRPLSRSFQVFLLLSRCLMNSA